jgi:preprotein translocase subunit SecB
MTEPAPERQVILQKIYLKDASMEVPLAPQIYTRQWQPQIDVQITTSLQALSAEQHQVLLSVTITARLDKDVAFLAEVHQAGIFLVKGQAGEAETRKLLGADCPGILFPFAREAAAELIQRAGFPQFLLQPVDFEALYHQHLTQNAEAARPH